MLLKSPILLPTQIGKKYPKLHFRFVSRYFHCIILMIIILFQSLITIQGQSPSSRIDYFNPNLPLLEYLIKLKIDSLRNIQGLSSLHNDTICYLAAKDHGEYLMDFEDINHFQENITQKYTPQDRVNYYGAKDYDTGENIVKIFIGIPFTYSAGPVQTENFILTTYREIAAFVAEAWKNSAVHYINILSPEYDVSGVSAVYNEDDRSLICVQVFADAGEGYDFHFHQGYFPYDNIFGIPESEQLRVEASDKGCSFSNPWGLEIHENLIKYDTTDAFYRLFEDCHIIYRKTEVYLYLGLYENAISLFSNEYDGLALEIIPLELYKCRVNRSNTNITSDNCPVRGTITKPIYRDRLLKKNLSGHKKGTVQKYLIPFAGEQPDLSDDSSELNVVVIKDRKIWKVIQTHHLCGEAANINIELPLYYGNIPLIDTVLPNNEINLSQVSAHSLQDSDKLLIFNASGTITEYNMIFEEFLKRFRMGNNNADVMLCYNHLDSLQMVLFDLFLKGEIQFGQIDSLPFLLSNSDGMSERSQPFAGLQFKRLVFKYKYLPQQMNDAMLLRSLSDLRKFRDPAPEILYNYIALYLSNDQIPVSENITPAVLREMHDIAVRVKDHIPSMYVDSLLLFYHLQTLNLNLQNETPGHSSTYRSLETVYNFFDNAEISASRRVELAKLFILFRMYNYAYQILAPVNTIESFHKEAYILSLKLFYSGMVQDEKLSEYYCRLIEAANMLSDEEWTGLFKGSCRINFQHLNYKPLWNLYCAKINDTK